MTVRRAARLARLAPYVFGEIGRRVAERRAAGADVVDLAMSDPDVAPAPAAVAALADALGEPGFHRYPPLAGDPGLQAAVAAWYARRFGVRIDPEREVLITPGSKEVLAHLALAFVDPGDAVLVPDPGYPAYRMPGELFGARTVFVPLRPENGFLPDLDEVRRIGSGARLWYVNYPNNPTGRVAPPEALAAWLAFCRAAGVVLVSDLAYADIVYEGRAHSVFEWPEAREVALETLTLSKGARLQGLRVAAVVGAPELVAVVARVEGHLNAGVFRPLQRAAATALTAPDPAVDDVWRPRRDRVCEGLRAAGYEVVRPDAAVYCWVAAPGGDGDRFFERALAAGVAVTPGSAFGPGSRAWVRIAFTQPLDRLEEALARLAPLAQP
jgi:LL-diaminopimelate aminotransferase